MENYKGMTCCVEGCTDPAKKAFLCKRHYDKRWHHHKIHGEVLTLEQLAHKPIKFRSKVPNKAPPRYLPVMKPTPFPHPEGERKMEHKMVASETPFVVDGGGVIRGEVNVAPTLVSPEVPAPRKNRKEVSARIQILLDALDSTTKLQAMWTEELKELLRA